MVNGSMASDYADIGTILDLTSYAEEYGITDKIDESYFKEMSADGAIYGIPWEDAHYAFILYNEGIFKEVGVTEFPKTLDELIDVSKRLQMRAIFRWQWVIRHFGRQIHWRLVHL